MLIILQNKNKNRNQGFIALVSAILISAVLMLAVLQNTTIVSDLFEQARLKQDRYGAVQSALYCLNKAVLELTHDYFFTVSSTTSSSGVSYQFTQCSIVSVGETRGGILGDGDETVTVIGVSSGFNATIVAQFLLSDRKINLLSEKTFFH